jgi:hypothetical protein
MKDMLGQDLNPGDMFLMPGGNARYGGLVLEIGIILSMTEKRLKSLTTRFDKIKVKPTTKTPIKVFKLQIDQELYVHENFGNLKNLYNDEAVLALRHAYIKHKNNNAT